MFTPAPPTARRCRVLYVSPLKALAVDVERNLRAPLAGIAQVADGRGDAYLTPAIAIRTGDTPAAERARFQREPADILITTPESLYLLLTSNAREALRSVDTDHHRRDPRARADQARRAPRAVDRAPRRALRAAAAADRALGDATAPRRSRAVSGRGRAGSVARDGGHAGKGPTPEAADASKPTNLPRPEAASATAPSPSSTPARRRR